MMSDYRWKRVAKVDVHEGHVATAVQWSGLAVYRLRLRDIVLDIMMTNNLKKRLWQYEAGNIRPFLADWDAVEWIEFRDDQLAEACAVEELYYTERQLVEFERPRSIDERQIKTIRAVQKRIAKPYMSVRHSIPKALLDAEYVAEVRKQEAQRRTEGMELAEIPQAPTGKSTVQ